jgi:MFS family permease
MPGLGALRAAPLRRLLLAQVTSTSGDYIVLVSLPFAIFSMGGGGVQVGLALGVRSAAMVSLVLLGGVVGDRLDRRTVMVIADLTRLATQAAVAALLLCGVAELWMLLGLLAIQGGASAFFQPAAEGLLPRTVDEALRQDANALSGLGTSGAAMIGPALAGVLIAATSVGWAYALDAATFAVSATLLAGIRLPAATRPAEEPAASSPLELLREGWAAFRRRTWLWAVVLEFGLLNALVFGQFEVLGPAAAERSLGGAAAWGLILAAAGVGALAGCLLALLWRPERPLLVATAAVACWAAPLVLLAVAAPLALIIPSAVVAGAGTALFGAIWQTTIQDNVPAEQRSRLSSYDWLGSVGPVPLGFLLAGVAEATIGITAGLLGASAILLLATAAVVALPSVRELRRRESHPTPLTPALSAAG